VVKRLLALSCEAKGCFKFYRVRLYIKELDNSFMLRPRSTKFVGTGSKASGLAKTPDAYVLW
jgi:hypothetical protein